MEVNFNNDVFDFYRSGVMILERLKNGVSSCVRVFIHEPFNQSFENSNMLFTDDKIQAKFNNGDFHFFCSGVMVLEILKTCVTSHVVAYTHEPFNQSFSNLSM